MRALLILVLCSAACESGTSGGADGGLLADAAGDSAVSGDAAGDGSGAGGPLVDGPLGSRIPGWDAQDPPPVLLLAHRVQPTAWLLAIADIGSDGAISGVVNVDRVRAFGFSGASAPAQVYDGPLAGAQVPGWSATAPDPILVLARRTGQTTWVTSLATIDAAGNLSGLVNVDRVRVYRFTAATSVDAALPGATLPGWNAAAPSAFLLAASQSGSPLWFVGSGSVADDGAIGDLAADRAIGWML